MNDKYFVLKRSDWTRANQSYGLVGILNELSIAEVPDAEVIRHQDVFAGPGLSAYANAIQTGIEMMRLLPISSNPALTPGELDAISRRITGLEVIRDYFFMAAQEAETVDKKLPD